MNKKLLLRYRILGNGTVAVWFRIIDDITINEEVTGSPSIIFLSEEYFRSHILNDWEEINLSKIQNKDVIVYNNVLDIDERGSSDLISNKYEGLSSAFLDESHTGVPYIAYLLGTEIDNYVVSEGEDVNIAKTHIAEAVFTASKIIETAEEINLARTFFINAREMGTLLSELSSGGVTLSEPSYVEKIDSLITQSEDGGSTLVEQLDEVVQKTLISENISEGNKVSIESRSVFELVKTMLTTPIDSNLRLITVASESLRKSFLSISESGIASLVTTKYESIIKNLLTATVLGGICTKVIVEKAKRENDNLITTSDNGSVSELTIRQADEMDNINLHLQETVNVAITTVRTAEEAEQIQIAIASQGSINLSTNLPMITSNNVYVISSNVCNLSVLYFIEADLLRMALQTSESINLSKVIFEDKEIEKSMVTSSDECYVDILDAWIFPIKDNTDLEIFQCYNITQEQNNLILQ